LQPLHTVVVTSPSPAEGNFQLRQPGSGQAHLTESSVLPGDFDLRRPIVHQPAADRSVARPFRLHHRRVHLCAGAAQGAGHQPLPAAGRHAGEESSRVAEHAAAKQLFEDLPRLFNWAIFDTPPLLFSADANLLSTMADGTILVVKIGSTTSTT